MHTKLEAICSSKTQNFYWMPMQNQVRVRKSEGKARFRLAEELVRVSLELWTLVPVLLTADKCNSYQRVRMAASYSDLLVKFLAYWSSPEHTMVKHPFKVSQGSNGF
jgi:hypothetical protein